ncbi:MAG: hypothetical protein LQ345_004720 [Seirophora villosa]|nr:MAG: hypothetical protein LQ345_004720 [Seirophora villosa]
MVRKFYSQPSRIHTARLYPIPSPDGSSILLIGCENGLQILWHGKRFGADGSLTHHNHVETKDGAESSLHGENSPSRQEGDDYDSATPVDSVVQSIKLSFGTAVLQLAVPHIPKDALQQHHTTIPALFTKNLVVAVVCSDSSVRLVTLPLVPPTRSNKGKAEADDEIFLANQQSGSYGERTVVISRGSDHQDIPRCVALTLTLALVEPSSDLDMDRDDVKPCVRSPLVSLHFHPALPGDEKNGRLLAAESNGTVKILNCLSTGTFRKCSYLVSLITSCQASAGNRGTRQHILDAQWVLGGKAILALLGDGEWELWDLEAHGPRSQSGTTTTQTRMDTFFSFAIRGHIGGGHNTLKADDANRPTQDGFKAARIAPTTPSTRRMRQENLFSGPCRDMDRPARGGISTVPKEDSRTTDEAVLLWHNDHLLVIPSLQTYWENRAKGSGNLFGNGLKSEATVLSNVSLRGERRTSVSLLPASYNSTYNDSPGYPVLVTGETRFVFVTGPCNREQAKLRRLASPPTDQRRLEQGDLDLDGMRRVLTNMSGKLPTEKPALNLAPPR